MPRIERALLSVTDKTGIVEFARAPDRTRRRDYLHRRNLRILKDAGIAPLREVASSHRISGDARRPREDHSPAHRGRDSRDAFQAGAHDRDQGARIPKIDLVCVNLYEFEKIAANPDAPLAELIENIDIGGPTMIRAAAKNYQDVAVVTSSADYAALIEELRANDGSLSPETHWNLAKKAFATTAAYDRAVSAPPRGNSAGEGASCPRFSTFAFPGRWPSLRRKSSPVGGALRKRQDRHRRRRAVARQGTLLQQSGGSRCRVAVDRRVRRPASAIIKHTNPVRLRRERDARESYRRAFEADPVSAYGGVLAFNREVDAGTAAEIAKTFIEAIAAPGYSEDALKILTAKRTCACCA